MVAEQKFFFKFYYIGGKDFYGSQRQKILPSIEENLINKFKEKNYIDDTQSSKFESASRTDRYVSARGAVFSLITKKKPVLMELNSSLPKDIGLWAYSLVPSDYSPRFNAILRHYKYIVPQPFSYLKKKYNINIRVMEKACRALIGNHDFLNFSKRSKEKKKTIRDMKFVDLNLINDSLILEFKSKAFLRQQIRRIVKKILELGMGDITFTEFINLLDTSEYVSYEPADPKGLILWDIEYDKNIKFMIDKKSIDRLNYHFQSQEYKYWLQYNLFNIMQKNDFS